MKRLARAISVMVGIAMNLAMYGLRTLWELIASASGRAAIASSRTSRGEKHNRADVALMNEYLRGLQERTQRAVSTILNASVVTAELDHSKIKSNLLEYESDIIGRLHEISNLQRRTLELVPTGEGRVLGRVTTNALEEQKQSLIKARRDCVDLLETLEQYARRIISVEEAFRDRQCRQEEIAEDLRQAQLLSTLDDRYLDLDALNATVSIAKADIERLAEEAESLEQALRDPGTPDTQV